MFDGKITLLSPVPIHKPFHAAKQIKRWKIENKRDVRVLADQFIVI